MLMLVRMLTWQVAHQSAVKSTMIGRPSARAFATASGLQAFHSSSGARVSDIVATVPVTSKLATTPGQRRFLASCTNSPQMQEDMQSERRHTPHQNTSPLEK